MMHLFYKALRLNYSLDRLALVVPDAIQLETEQETLFSCSPFGEDLKDRLGYDVLARVMLTFTVGFILHS